jgi:tryptophan-rich sensory protein
MSLATVFILACYLDNNNDLSKYFFIFHYLNKNRHIKIILLSLVKLTNFIYSIIFYRFSNKGGQIIIYSIIL